MAKHARKGANPSLVDSWLDGLGYYRKNVAYDETCLFRAISEQLFSCQIHHERCRKEVISYVRSNHQDFDYLMSKEKLFNHLELLEKHLIVSGALELQMISKTYRANVIIFKAGNKDIETITHNESKTTLKLCLMGDDHYDAVYKRDYILTAGFCQSIVYGLVYEKVFEMKNVSQIVDAMLNDNTFAGNVNGSHSSKENLNISKEHQNISKEHQIISKEYQNISKEYQNISKEHQNISKEYQNISKEHQNISNENKNVSKETQNVRRTGSKYKTNGNKVTNKDWVKVEGDLKQVIDLKSTPFSFRVAKALDQNIYRNIEYDTWMEMRKEMRLGSWYYGDENLIRGTRCLLKAPEGILQCYIQDLEKKADKCVVYITSLAEKRLVKYTDLNPEPDAKPWPLPYRFAARSNNAPILNEVSSTNDFNNNNNITNNVRERKDMKRGGTKGRENVKRNQNRAGNRNVPPLTLPIKTDVVLNECVKDFEGSPLLMQQSDQQFDQPSMETLQNHQVSFPPEQSWVETLPIPNQIHPETLYNTIPHPLYNNSPEIPVWSMVPDIQTPQQSFPSPGVLMPPNSFHYFDQPINSPLIPVTPIQSLPVYPSVYSSSAPVTPIVYATAPESQDLVVCTPPTGDSYSRMYSPGYNPPIDMSFLSPPYVFPSTSSAASYYVPPPIDAQGFVFPPPITPQK